jgi:hypothetical protein
VVKEYGIVKLVKNQKKQKEQIKVVPHISRHFLMHWMSVKLPDNFQMREHSWPCRFHIYDLVDGQNHEILKPAISGLYIRFHPVYQPCFYFTRKQMTGRAGFILFHFQ